jgi:hypothetical protein
MLLGGREESAVGDVTTISLEFSLVCFAKEQYLTHAEYCTDMKLIKHYAL